MAPRETILRGGYFTWLDRLYDLDCSALELAIGFSTGSLGNGWRMFTPRYPLVASNIDLRGSARNPDGVMGNGKQIGELIAARTNVSAAREKVAKFFDRGLDRRPVKVFPNLDPSSYPAAPRTGGLAQFRLFTEIEWVFVLDVASGAALTRAAAAGASW